MEPAVRTAQGLLWRIVFTIIVLSAFLVGSVVYVAFYAKGFNLFQQFAVFFVGFIVAVAVVAILWLTWAGRRGMMRGWWAS